MAAALLAVIPLLSACDTDGDDGAAATRPTPSTEATTTTGAPSTTVPFDVEVRRAAAELMEVRNEVFQAPDPARVAEYALPGCDCFAREQQILTRFVEEGSRWRGPGFEPLGVRIVDPDPATPSVVLVARQLPNAVVNSAGEELRPLAAAERVGFIIVIDRDGLADWRFAGFGANPDFDQAVLDAVVVEGIP